MTYLSNEVFRKKRVPPYPPNGPLWYNCTTKQISYPSNLPLGVSRDISLDIR